MLKRTLLAVALGLVAITAATSVYFRVEQYRFRRRVEYLLADLRALEFGKSSDADVQHVAGRWGFGKLPSEEEQNSKDSWDYSLDLVTNRSSFFEFFGVGQEARAARILTLLGQRPAFVHARMGVQGKVLRSESFSVRMDVRDETGDEEILMGSATASRKFWLDSSHQSPTMVFANSLAHPGYLVGKRRVLANSDYRPGPWAGILWVEFSADAEAADVSRLMDFDLSCLTRLTSCRERDLMPAAWAEQVKDEQRPPVTPICTPELSRHAAYLADGAAVARVDAAGLQPPPAKGYAYRMPVFELKSLLRGPKRYADLRYWFNASVEVDRPEMVVTADTGVRPGSEEKYILLLQGHVYGGHEAMALYPCGILTLNDSNLAMVRATASAEGAE